MEIDVGFSEFLEMSLNEGKRKSSKKRKIMRKNGQKGRRINNFKQNLKKVTLKLIKPKKRGNK